jgi:hypothetical protein
MSAYQGVKIMGKIALAISKLARSLGVLAAIPLPALYAAPAHAQIFHTWVSHSGSDANSCTSTAHCASFTHALSQTGDGGEVSCLDSGSFGAFVVSVSVTIDCSGTVATPLGDVAGCSFNVIDINAPAAVVTLRGLNVTALSTGFPGCGSVGIIIRAATAVYIEDCVIENFPHQGIIDTRTTGLTKLAIKNTIVRNNASAGIVAAAAPKNSVVLENVHSVGNAYGIGVASGNNVVISRSVMSENAIAGIEADPGAQVYVENTKISHKRELRGLCPGNGGAGQLGYRLQYIVDFRRDHVVRQQPAVRQRRRHRADARRRHLDRFRSTITAA